MEPNEEQLEKIMTDISLAVVRGQIDQWRAFYGMPPLVRDEYRVPVVVVAVETEPEAVAP